MKIRFIHAVGTKAALRVYWGSKGLECPNCLGGGKLGYHNAEVLLGFSDERHAQIWGRPEDYEDSRWPTKCDHCPAVVPANLPISPPVRSWDNAGNEVEVVNRQIFTKTRYNTASGSPEPGDVFDADWFHSGGHCPYWDDCKDRHLIAILPNKQEWHLQGKASNCTMPEDRTHRCWVVHGRPEDGTLHVDKNGRTCRAGAGSIVAGSYHGFLQHGAFRSC